MEAAIRLLNEMVTRCLLDSYAIGGAMASLFYAEPVATFDLDVFVLLPTAQSDRTIVTLEPQIAFLREHGAVQEGEHVVIQGLPVQILPAYNALVTEAMKQAVTRRVGQVETRVCRQEHLLAILVQTGRDKDRRITGSSRTGSLYVEDVCACGIALWGTAIAIPYGGSIPDWATRPYRHHPVTSITRSAVPPRIRT